MSTRNENKEIEKYKEATWAFIMEHCDVFDSGKIFVKFHIDNRKNFEKRVWARYKYDYHREDWETKYDTALQKRNTFKNDKKQRMKEYQTMKLKRRAEQQKKVRMEEWSNWYTKTQEGGILARLIGYIASKTWKKKP